MKKNDMIDLEITDTTLLGAGVGHVDGVAVFVNSAVEGDIVKAHILKVKSNCAFAKIHETILPSKARVIPNCPVYSKCGGCAFLHVDYAKELEIKEKNVKNCLKRIGGTEPELETITGLCPEMYRNKCQYPVTQTDGELKIGFYSRRSHRVTDCRTCLLQPKEFAKAVRIIETYLRDFSVPAYDETAGKGLIRHIYLRKAVRTGELMVCLVTNGKSIPRKDELIARLREEFGENLKSVILNFNTKQTNVILGETSEILYGDGYITDILCGVKVRISPLSFYQVNHDVAELLYEKVAEYAEPDGKTVVDLYCGAGTIGLSMAKRAKRVIGVEIVPDAVADAEFNARENGFSNCKFLCGDAADAALKLKAEGIKPDAVILDPPRKGCDAELIRTVAEDFSPERVVYVSCDPATLARDCRIFEEYGYTTGKAAPFDMFPRTGHVETAALLSRREIGTKEDTKR